VTAGGACMAMRTQGQGNSEDTGRKDHVCTKRWHARTERQRSDMHERDVTCASPWLDGQ